MQGSIFYIRKVLFGTGLKLSMVLTSLKYLENFSASSVAEVTMIFRSLLTRATFLIRPKRTSVCSVLSWASSKMMKEYWSKLGSLMPVKNKVHGVDSRGPAHGQTVRTSNEAVITLILHSLSNMPSVMYLILVFSLVESSKRILKPTSAPTLQGEKWPKASNAVCILGAHTVNPTAYTGSTFYTGWSIIMMINDDQRWIIDQSWF